MSEWTPRASRASGAPDKVQAVLRGFSGRCPACGEGRLFGKFLKVADRCGSCDAEFHHHRADDFPPYLVMFFVGHLVGYGIYMSETRIDDVPLWLHATLWPSLAIGLSLALLQPVKGAVVGLQYSLGMHGFGGASRPGAGSRGMAGERGQGRTAADADRGRGPRPNLAEPDAP